MSLVLTLFSIILVITIAFTIAVPALADSVRSIVPLVKEKWPEWAAFLNSYNIDLSQVSEWIQPSDWEKLSSGANVLWDSAVSVASTTISGVVNTVFAVVIAVYILLSKRILAVQVKKFMYAHL